MAALAGLLLLVPVGASVVRALSVGWVPTGDNALIVLRAFDTFSDDAPLTGQPSTADLYVDEVAPRHPGPFEFQLLAIPVRVLGPALGTLVTTGAIAGASVLIAAWVAFRRGGWVVGLGATVMLSLVMFSTGTSVLTDPLSSNAGGYPLMAGAALAWALWCDDRRLWPLAVAVWSYTMQQHLSIFGLGSVVAAWGTAGAVVTMVSHRREVGRIASSLRWGAAAAATGVLCWAAPLVDQFAGSGNLSQMFAFTGTDRPALGLDVGLRPAARAIAAPSLLLDRTNAGSSTQLIAPFEGLDLPLIGLGVILMIATAGAAVLARRRRPDAGPRLALLATGLVVAVGGTITTANVPDSIEAFRISFYRWVWTVSVAAWGAVVWAGFSWWGETAVASRVPRFRGDAGPPAAARTGATARDGQPSRARTTGVTAVAVACLTGATLVVGFTALRTGAGDERRGTVLFAFDARAADAALATIPPDRPVRLRSEGQAAFLEIAPSLAVAFVDAGLEVHVEPFQGDFYGEHRATRPTPDETIVTVVSASEPSEADLEAPGDVVARLQLPLEPGGEGSLWGDDAFQVHVLVPG